MVASRRKTHNTGPIFSQWDFEYSNETHIRCTDVFIWEQGIFLMQGNVPFYTGLWQGYVYRPLRAVDLALPYWRGEVSCLAALWVFFFPNNQVVPADVAVWTQSMFMSEWRFSPFLMFWRYTHLLNVFVAAAQPKWITLVFFLSKRSRHTSNVTTIVRKSLFVPVSVLLCF